MENNKTIRGFIKNTEDIEEMHFAVDIPKVGNNGEPQEEWYCVDYFKTKKEAIKFARKYFGADENGMICLISTF